MTTTIGPSLVITGELTAHEDVVVHGRVKGHVHMREGSLLVAPKGQIDANVHGTRVTIHGSVAGDVSASERIELTPSCDVTATLTAQAIVLQDGAKFNGLIDMPARASKSGAAAPAPFAPARPVAQAS